MARMPGILQESMALTYAIIPHTPSNGAAGVNTVSSKCLGRSASVQSGIAFGDAP